MHRRDFIKVVAGSAVTWPLTAGAQQPEQMRRIGILMNRAASDAEGQARLATFKQGLEQLGWNEGRNIRIDIRWGEDKSELERKYPAELVALAPDIILASGTVSVTALQALSHAIPIVFAAVADPVGAGFVESMGRPGGNTTGFMIFEYSFGGKLLELLRQIAPNVTRVRCTPRSHQSRLGRHVRRRTGRSSAARRGGESGRHTHCRSDRVQRRGFRRLGEWRPDRHARPDGIGSWCFDCRACGALQAAGDLSFPL